MAVTYPGSTLYPGPSTFPGTTGTVVVVGDGTPVPGPTRITLTGVGLATVALSSGGLHGLTLTSTGRATVDLSSPGTHGITIT